MTNSKQEVEIINRTFRQAQRLVNSITELAVIKKTTTMRQFRKIICFSVIIILIFSSCKSSQNGFVYKKDGKKYKDNISCDFISKNGNLKSAYVSNIKFGYLDSISFPENNPDNMISHISYKPLNFNKKTAMYSPEYYAIFTVHHIHKVIDYYNYLFNNKIDFNSQDAYKNIEIIFSDVDLLTTPRVYAFEEGEPPAPSLIYHEIGHRAFWYIQDKEGLDVKFNGLTIVHMGLLEYFNMSLNNCPVEVEESNKYPNLFRRDARMMYKYPMDSTYNLRYTFKNLEKAYEQELQNTNSNISKYLSACYSTYNDYVLDNYQDNHYGGMILASTLWRIREKIGQEKTDKLVAETILSLNQMMKMRKNYYKADINSLPEAIEWCDVYYGLIKKDIEYFKGENIDTIKKEFLTTGYPIEKIKL